MMSHDRELGARHYNMHSKTLCVNRAGLCRNMNSEDLFISEGRCNEIAIRCHGVTVSQCHSVTMSQCHGVTVSRFSHRMPVPIILYSSMRTVTNIIVRFSIGAQFVLGLAKCHLDTPMLREYYKKYEPTRPNEGVFSHNGWNRFIFYLHVLFRSVA